MGLLPFIKIPYDIAPLPLLTRDYTERRMQQLRDEKYPWKVKFFFALHLAISPLLNLAEQGLVSHLNKRGILTSYFVVNRDEEL